jgi:hypothetical protein
MSAIIKQQLPICLLVTVLLGVVAGCNKHSEPAKPASERPMPAADTNQTAVAKSGTAQAKPDPTPQGALLTDALDPDFWRQLETNSARQSLAPPTPSRRVARVDLLAALSGKQRK